jgi:tetratricopeptide (TPR) repeat protein
MKSRRSSSARGFGTLWQVSALIALVAGAYHSVGHLGFVNWDDYLLIVNNGLVKRGPTWGGMAWAFTTTFSANYIPLTWASHMLDVSWFGMWAGGHHLISALWHLVNTVLLYFVLRDATGAASRSFWVAALFAVHPLHVESVAWISERKDVLSTFFWLAGLWSYIRYARKPSPICFAPVILTFLLGLLAKPMLVTFPLTLLLLDYWPLKRWEAHHSAWPLVKEKLALFLLSSVFAAVALWAQSRSGAVSAGEILPLGARIANALASVGQYLWHLPFPVQLSAIHPHRGTVIAWGPTLASVAAIMTISIFAVRRTAPRPYIAVGWFWFLGTLVPVLGLVQVGVQAWAERYTYVPYVGLFVAVVWLMADITQAYRPLRRAAVATGAVVIVSFTWLSYAQTLVWKNDLTLFTQVVGRYPDAFEGNYRLATYYRIHDRWTDAVASSRRCVEIAPNRFDGWTSLGLALQGLGRTDEAGDALRKAYALSPNSSATILNLALFNESVGQVAEAESGYRRVLAINPLEERSLLHLATLLTTRGEVAEAKPLVQKLVSLFLAGWTVGTTSGDVGMLCARTELWPEARKLLEDAVGDAPRNAALWSNLGLARQRQRDYLSAIEAYKRAVEIEPRMIGAHFNCGVACLQNGDIRCATESYEALMRLDGTTASKLQALIRAEQLRRGMASPDVLR